LDFFQLDNFGLLFIRERGEKLEEEHALKKEKAVFLFKLLIN